MAQEDHPRRRADALRGEDVVVFLDRQHLAAHQPGVGRSGDDRDGDGRVPDAGAENGGDGQREHQCRESHHRVDDAHHRLVEDPTEIARDEPDGHPDGDRDEHRDDPDLEREPGAVQGAAEQVPAELVGAEGVLGGGSGQHRLVVHPVRLVRGDPRREQGEPDLERDQHCPEHRQAMAQQEAQRVARGAARGRGRSRHGGGHVAHPACLLALTSAECAGPAIRRRDRRPGWRPPRRR